MRQKHLFIPSLREVPAEAEAESHRLLLKGGFIRQLASGVYSYLPLGLRVLHRMESIIREEMERTGAQELRLPAVQPAELLQQSGRYALYGPELFRLDDRHQREFALGPTHEEVITSIVRDEIHSYRRTAGGAVPDFNQIPRRTAPAVRPGARQRIFDEGCLLVHSGLGGAGPGLPGYARRV
ncbi:hypothetical protein LJK88_12995 [Paenibacillus sp. P26]|nr:hypothetical protein LJK88_12995 [Paenibacillus sp. P26]